MFSKPEDALDYFYNLFTVHREALGLQYVGYGDENILPRYPVVLITSGPLVRLHHATRQFELEFRLDFWIYHANLNVDHKTRTQEDLALVTALRELVHSDYNCRDSNGDKGVVFGWIQSETPGVVNRPKGEAVVGTRCNWYATAIEAF